MDSPASLHASVRWPLWYEAESDGHHEGDEV